MGGFLHRHRVHHAVNLEYLDGNYGGVLIVFDRLFGTYRAERDDLPCRYGLVTPPVSYNPLRVEFHQWIASRATWCVHAACAPCWEPC